MGEKIVVGPINKGLRTDRTPFVIDNDSFPTLINAYQWRGRVKRKRGTSQLGRLKRYFDSTSSAFTGTTVNPSFKITFDGGGNSNLFGPYTNATPISFSLDSSGNIVPGSVSITASVGPVTYTDPTKDGYLTPTGTLGVNTINYASGAIHIPAQASGTATVHFNYYPTLPVMGLEELILDPTDFPGCIAFDTRYSYNISTSDPYPIYDVSFYKNVATGTYVNYVQKTAWTPTSWNGQDYQQFWTTNYQRALWTTNGIDIPFDASNVGMQYKAISAVAVTSAGAPAKATLTISAHGLVVGDFVFINEVVTTTGINFQTGYVIAVTDANTVVVEFPSATIATDGTGGIAQYLTNRSDVTKDSLRWYDGDPTTGNPSIPAFATGDGWVNFAPPLSQLEYSISDLPAAEYYLVGARMIVPFKDRLLLVGPVIQTSSPGSQVYLPDTVIYSQNGTPYYTCSFPYATSVPVAGIPTQAILVPTFQTATYSAYWEDQTGFGGYIQAGVSQPINTVSSNEDVLILGFATQQVRFIYTGNDIVPFNFFTINSELGSESTFSTVNLDRGVLTVGTRGFVITAQNQAARFDPQIPDQVFEFDLTNNGSQRVCSQRDFVNEWIYFTYDTNASPYNFPSQTLQYNYRDESWAIFNESYTTYGTFKKKTGLTWATLDVELTWESWNDPWNSSITTLAQPEVIGGNQQGFVMIRAVGTAEGNSLAIQNIVGNVVTSPNHGLNENDYIIINGALGTIASPVNQVNGKIFSVQNPTNDTFILNPGIAGGTYLGLGTITRMYVPLIQTKQFPVSWDMARKTRLGPQMYLLSTTNKGQITLLIFLSQDASAPYNAGSIVPTELPAPVNNSLVYSTILFTCPESTNLGLTPANINLQMLTASSQAQIWHRINTSLLGDTIQLGFTMSDAQMRDTGMNNQFVEIELHGFILDVSPSMNLA